MDFKSNRLISLNIKISEFSNHKIYSSRKKNETINYKNENVI